MNTPKILNNIDRESICYLQSSINYTLLFLQDGKSVISAYNMKVFEELFKHDNFVKINRSKIVNVDFIQRTLIDDKTHVILLLNGDRIAISRRRLNGLKENYPAIF